MDLKYVYFYLKKEKKIARWLKVTNRQILNKKVDGTPIKTDFMIKYVEYTFPNQSKFEF